MTTQITPPALSQQVLSDTTAESRPELRRCIPGPVVTLRQFTPNDVDPMFEAAYHSRFEVARWLAWCHPDYRREETVAYVESRPAAWKLGEEFSFAIVDTKSERLLGGCAINQINWLHQIGNLGYWVRTDAVGQGFATAAARALAQAALEDLNLERVEIWADVQNTASRRVAEKCGATFEAIARKRLHARYGQRDAAGYSLIRDDFRLPPIER